MSTEALVGKISLDGIERVLRELKQVKAAQENVAKSADEARATLGRVGAAMSVAAATTGAVAIKSYETFERLRRILASSVGANQGNALADQVQELTLKARTANDSLMQVARTWVAMTNDAKTTLPLLQALDNFKGLGLSDFQVENVGRALAQIKVKGKVMAEELQRQLAESGIPLQKIAESLGKKSPRELLGMDGKKFIDAVIKVGRAERPGGLLPSELAMNLIDSIKVSLNKTGELLGKILTPIAAVVQGVVNAFRSVNEATGGAAGLAAIIGGAVIGFKLMAPALMQAAGALVVFLHSNQAAIGGAVAGGQLGGVASALRLALAFKVLGPAIADIAKSFDPVVKAIRDVVAPIVTKIAKQFEAINEFFGGWPSKILATVILLAEVRRIMVWISALNIANQWASIVGFARTYLTIANAMKVVEAARAVIAAAMAAFTGNWVGLAIGAAILGIGIGAAAGAFGGGKDSKSMVPGKPMRRSDPEQVYWRAMGNAMRH